MSTRFLDICHLSLNQKGGLMSMFCMAFQEVKGTQQLGWNTQSIVLSCCFLSLSKVILSNYYIKLIESFYLQFYVCRSLFMVTSSFFLTL
jgi:hypothetical protein